MIEVITMSAEIVIAITSGILATALWYHRKAVLLQKDSLQATLFNEVSRRINELLDQEPNQKEKVELDNWYVRLFNAFEHFAFFANHGYLQPLMESYYRSGLEGYCERVRKECPELVEKLKNRSREQFSELRKYCKELPF